MTIVTKISKLFGSLVGSLLTEKGLAIWIYSGRPVVALVWAFGRYLMGEYTKKMRVKSA